MSKPEIIEVFRSVADNIPTYIKTWEEKNKIDKKIPRHYDELSMVVELNNTHHLKIKMQRTVTGKVASYADPISIMDAFKRAHITLVKTGTMQAYDVHLRYNKEHQMYIPLLMDEKRLITMDEKHHAMDFIDNDMYEKIKNMQPAPSSVKYPTVMKFSIKR